MSRRPEYVVTLWVSPQLRERQPGLEPGLYNIEERRREQQATAEADVQPEADAGPEAEPGI